MEILMANCQISVGDIISQPGHKVIQVIDQQGNIVSIPLSEEAARNVAMALSSGLVIATPAMVMANNKQK